VKILNNYIPTTSPVFQKLEEVASSSDIVIFSGLPGVGKSLYIREFQLICKSLERPVDVIQWDVARKAFETDYIQGHYPMGEGTVHDGLKLIAGSWLLDEVRLWAEQYMESDRLMLIEAPLVGHRFIELVKKNSDTELEEILVSQRTKVVVPIPSIEVRVEIEAERARQVKEQAKVWSGAKPSVMLMLWKMTCEIANEFGKKIDLSGQPPYDPEVYDYVYSRILKHRNYVPLIIDELFEVPTTDEAELHNEHSLQADQETANHYGRLVIENVAKAKVKAIVDEWYRT